VSYDLKEDSKSFSGGATVFKVWSLGERGLSEINLIFYVMFGSI
jgi:hypothetical protein